MSEQVVGVINPVMALIYSIGAFLLWRRDTSQRYIIGMTIALLALGISFSINHYVVIENALLVRFTASLFVFIGVIALVSASCMRLSAKPPFTAWIIGGGTTLALIAFADPAEDITAWLFLVNTFCGLVFAMGAQVLHQANSSEPIDRATIWVFALIAAQFFIRPTVVYLLVGPMGSEAYRESAGYAVYIVVSALSMVLLAGVLMGSAVVDLMKALKRDAQNDSLSGLAMRDAFVQRSVQVFADARAQGVPVSMIVADIDHFKKVNDVWGHPAGDKAIAALGKVFLQTIRDTDLVGRIGGEEFCVLVWNCPEVPAAKLADRLRVKFACSEHEALGADIRLTASFGVTAWRPGETYDEVYERADAALYQAKREGRNKAVSHRFGVIDDVQELVPGSPEREEQRTAGDSASIVEIAHRKTTRREVL